MKNIDYRDIDQAIKGEGHDQEHDKKDCENSKKKMTEILGITETPQEYYARLAREKKKAADRDSCS